MAQVFMEAVSTEEKESLPAYRAITDPDRIKTYSQWVDNDAAKWAFDLYGRAWKIAHPNSEKTSYYIALVSGGNHAEVGFKLVTDSGKQSFPTMSYIKLDPDPSVFKTVLLHETGHMVLAIFNEGKKIPQKGIASVPHTTAALTDRGTAFDEGFAIHLETLAAHFLKDPDIQSRYNHQNFQFGVPLMLGEYHRIAGDLLSYSQTSTRYHEVRENYFAFASAYKECDYFRVQLEKSRDFSELRDANQLLQSEGFYASFFFAYLIRGSHQTFDEEVKARQNKMLLVLAELLKGGESSADTPFLLNFVKEHQKEYPEEQKEILDVLLDLSHGVFVEGEAGKYWKDHYLASLSMNMAETKNTRIEEARERWRKEALENSTILFSLLGPQVAVEVPSKSILLIAFEEAAPLAFDVNTAEEGILRCIPGISQPEISSWLNQRKIKPFTDFNDFQTRSGLSKIVLKEILPSQPAE